MSASLLVKGSALFPAHFPTSCPSALGKGSPDLDSPIGTLPGSGFCPVVVSTTLALPFTRGSHRSVLFWFLRQVLLHGCLQKITGCAQTQWRLSIASHWQPISALPGIENSISLLFVCVPMELRWSKSRVEILQERRPYHPVGNVMCPALFSVTVCAGLEPLSTSLSPWVSFKVPCGECWEGRNNWDIPGLNPTWPGLKCYLCVPSLQLLPASPCNSNCPTATQTATTPPKSWIAPPKMDSPERPFLLVETQEPLSCYPLSILKAFLCGYNFMITCDVIYDLKKEKHTPILHTTHTTWMNIPHTHTQAHHTYTYTHISIPHMHTHTHTSIPHMHTYITTINNNNKKQDLAMICHWYLSVINSLNPPPKNTH